MAQQQQQRRQGSNGRQQQQGGQGDYRENPGWASAFDRPDAADGQPRFTGTGLDPDGNEIQISVWLRRSRNGVRFMRIHIEPPYDGGDNDGGDDGGDDLPW